MSCRRRRRRSRRRHRCLRRLRPPSSHHRRHCRAIFAAHAAAATASSQPPLPARPPPMTPMPPLPAACASPRCREPACPRACPRELARAPCTAQHRTALCEAHVRAGTRAALPQAPALCAPCSKTDERFDDMFVCVCTCARCPPQRFLMLCTVSCEELEQLVLAITKYLVNFDAYDA